MIPEDRQRTYKPFHHVYQSDGEGFLTKGPGGKFTHHRGIYYGFSKCSFTDKEGKKHRVDTWHCKGAYQTHEKFIRSHADSKSAGHTVEIAWRLDDGSVFALETRTLRFSLRPDDSLQIDFGSVLSTDHQPLILDGDPQHAGFQFRASDEAASSTARQTYHVRPKEGRDEAGKTKNWPADKDMTNLPGKPRAWWFPGSDTSPSTWIIRKTPSPHFTVNGTTAASDPTSRLSQNPENPSESSTG